MSYLLSTFSPFAIKPSSEKIEFKDGNENTRAFSPISDFCLKAYHTAMGVWTIANFKIFYPGIPLLDQKPYIQGLCERAAFHCGYNPTYPHITEFNLVIPSRTDSWVRTVHMTSENGLNKLVLKEHRKGPFDGGSLSYDAAFDLLQKIFPETQFTKEDFLLTCGEDFTLQVHKQILQSLKGTKLNLAIKKEGAKLVERWKTSIEPFDLAKEMRHLTSAIITKAIFGNSEKHRELSDAVDFMNIYLVKQVLGGFTQEDKENFLVSCKVFAEIINGIINDENSKFFPIFHKDFTIPQKQGLCLVMFFAGQETSAFALTHNLAELALNPALQKKLRGTDKKELNQFINRQLIKTPPVDGISRKLKVDTYIEFENEDGEKVGKLMKKGDGLTANFTETAKHLGANSSFEDANVFGGGANGCIGKDLALKELKNITALVLSEFELITEEVEFKYETQATKQAKPFIITVKNISG